MMDFLSWLWCCGQETIADGQSSIAKMKIRTPGCLARLWAISYRLFFRAIGDLLFLFDSTCKNAPAFPTTAAQLIEKLKSQQLAWA
jgi:hypothetical protein